MSTNGSNDSNLFGKPSDVEVYISFVKTPGNGLFPCDPGSQAFQNRLANAITAAIQENFPGCEDVEVAVCVNGAPITQ